MPKHAVSFCSPTCASVFRDIVFSFKRGVSQSLVSIGYCDSTAVNSSVAEVGYRAYNYGRFLSRGHFVANRGRKPPGRCNAICISFCDRLSPRLATPCEWKAFLILPTPPQGLAL